MEMKSHKRQMRKMEKKWLKHKSEPYWIAYKKCRNSYYGKLNFKKKVTLKHKLAECNKNSKKIHTLINNLTTKQQPQQWPSHKIRRGPSGRFHQILSGKNHKNQGGT